MILETPISQEAKIREMDADELREYAAELLDVDIRNAELNQRLDLCYSQYRHITGGCLHWELFSQQFMNHQPIGTL